MTNQPVQPAWEREFDEKFPVDYSGEGNDERLSSAIGYDTQDELRGFIRSTLSSLLDEVEIAQHWYQDSRQWDGYADAIRDLDSLKSSLRTKYGLDK